MEGSEGEEEAGGQEGGLGREEKENALEGKREREREGKEKEEGEDNKGGQLWRKRERVGDEGD